MCRCQGSQGNPRGSVILKPGSPSNTGPAARRVATPDSPMSGNTSQVVQARRRPTSSAVTAAANSRPKETPNSVATDKSGIFIPHY